MDSVSPAELSDDDLRKELISRGVDVGPIMPTTRKLYENKLLKLLGGRGDSDDRQEEDMEDDYEESEEEEQVEPLTVRQPIIKPKTATPTRSSYGTTATQRNVPSNTNGNNRSGEDSSSSTFTGSQSSQKKGVSLWLKLLFLVGIVFLAYLVFINMESSAENKVPKSLPDGSV